MSMARVLSKRRAATTAHYGEASVVSNRTKGGSFPSIGATGKAKDSMTATKVHNGARIMARCAIELR